MFPPRDPTRRRFLAVAAVASVVSAGTLAAAAAMDPSVPAAERAIADDVEFLKPHPVRQSRKRDQEQ